MPTILTSLSEAADKAAKRLALGNIQPETKKTGASVQISAALRVAVSRTAA